MSFESYPTAPLLTIGTFRVIRLLGSGGTSMVYLAKRVGSFSQQVVIKLLHGPHGLVPAEDEGRLLCSLEHANIVRLLDRGIHESGQRYLVMEFVDGLPIDRYCDDKLLTNAQRIQLLIEVLGGVSHAHRHLVLHVDLKPTNILVDRSGVPKLLDFGSGSAMGVDGQEPEGDLSMAISPHTPAFASPEQKSGQRATAASDIYSMGLIARLVLQGGGAEVEGDLAKILDKATRPEPDRRYRSAREFADDLQALLDHRPIRARPASPAYLAGRWMRRHRAAAVMTLTLLAVLAASVAGVLVQTVRAIHQRQLATARLQEIVHLTGILEGELYDSVRPLGQGDKASASLLEAATKSLDGLAADTGGDSALALEVARQYGKLARLEQARGGDESAAAASVAQGLALLRQIPRSDKNYAAAHAEMESLSRQPDR
jgi:predicted Ser/Thr protein kinase